MRLLGQAFFPLLIFGISTVSTAATVTYQNPAVNCGPYHGVALYCLGIQLGDGSMWIDTAGGANFINWSTAPYPAPTTTCFGVTVNADPPAGPVVEGQLYSYSFAATCSGADQSNQPYTISTTQDMQLYYSRGGGGRGGGGAGWKVRILGGMTVLTTSGPPATPTPTPTATEPCAGVPCGGPCVSCPSCGPPACGAPCLLGTCETVSGSCSCVPYTPAPVTPTPPSGCVGDCTNGHAVTVAQLITLVDIALGTRDRSVCAQGIPAFVPVNVTLIVQAVNNAMRGCPSAAPTPTPIPLAR